MWICVFDEGDMLARAREAWQRYRRYRAGLSAMHAEYGRRRKARARRGR